MKKITDEELTNPTATSELIFIAEKYGDVLALGIKRKEDTEGKSIRVFLFPLMEVPENMDGWAELTDTALIKVNDKLERMLTLAGISAHPIVKAARAEPEVVFNTKMAYC